METNPTPHGVDAAVLEMLADANHILADEGIVDAFGHVSLRHGEGYLLARNMAPGQVEPGDIMRFDLDSNPLDGDTRRPYLERYIHGEIYKARPDVMAVVHSHSPTVVPFSVARGAPLRPVCHMCGFLRGGPPVFEIRDEFGEATDLLIRNARMGAALARSLGEEHAVLMRGHGSTVAANSLPLVVYRAIYTEVNARLLHTARALGEVEYLTLGEAEATMKVHEDQIHRPWNLWRAQARERRGQPPITA